VNFFEHQERARRKTTQLVLYYSLAVALIILTLNVVAALIFQAGQLKPDTAITLQTLWNPQIFLWVTIGSASLILIGTLYKVHTLAAGGESVARMLGGQPIPPNTSDPHERRVLNVVEEMAIASGIPVPRVFILNDEQGLNAFAAGFAPADAVIGVTRGAVRLLSRDELQGVVAHEFSHILNGDMRLNLRLIGVLNGILLIAIAGYWIFRIVLNSSPGRRVSRDKKGGGAIVLAFIVLGLAMMVVGYIGVFFGRLIKSAVSRQREFLADASSVQFTRNPLGIVGALKKIGGFSGGSRMLSPHAEEASHLFFANGLKSFFLKVMATHPPLPERIRRIDPTFDGTFPHLIAPAAEADLSLVAPEPIVSRDRAVVAAPALAFALEPAAVVASVGAPQAAHVTYAATLLAALPPEIRAAVREPLSAQAVFFCLLLNKEGDFRAKQLQRLSTHANMVVYRETLALADRAATLPAETRLAVADLALAALRHLSPAQYAEFRKNAFDLAAEDMQITLFEYALLRTIQRKLDPQFGLAKRLPVRYHTLAAVADECALVLATLAWYGNEERNQSALAFAHGAREFGPEAEGLSLRPRTQCALQEVDKALDKLMSATPQLKARIVAACAACVSVDGQVTIDEGELLRAVADALECPIPPFLPHAE
jgi:Zn-dependent protease with chaperone function